MNSIAPADITPAWPTPLPEIIAELQRHAKVCETASEDLTEAALTGGETSDKEKNTRAAEVWMIKATIWLEAVEVARGFAESSTRREPEIAHPVPHGSPCI